MKLVWDAIGEKRYEMGTDHGVLYPAVDGAYPKGVVWNGLTAFNESPEGGDANDMWADNIKYGSIRAAEKYNFSIEAYTYPDEFAACNGEAEVAPGVTIGQQSRKSFGFAVRTLEGNDVDQDAGYKLHLCYGCTASPSGRDYSTVNDSPDAITFSWDVETTPVNVSGFKPTASLTIDSIKAGAEKMKKIEDILYGTDSEEARLPLPDEVISILTADVAAASARTTVKTTTNA